VTHQDHLERSLVAWFESEAVGPAPADALNDIVSVTRERRPRSTFRARLVGGWPTDVRLAHLPRIPWRLVGAVALLVVTLAGAIYVGARRDLEAVVSLPNGNGVITYEFNGDVYLADLESGRSTVLSHDPAAEHSPAFSPDGSLIAFTRDREHQPVLPADRSVSPLVDVVVMNADGSERRVITRPEDEYSGNLAWLPGSRSIVMSGRGSGSASPLFRLDASGLNDPEDLSPPFPENCHAPCVFPLNGIAPQFRPPKGEQIALGGFDGLRIYDVRSHAFTSIGDDLLAAWQPAWVGAGPWSPDGSRLALLMQHANSPNSTDANIGWFVLSADGLALNSIGGQQMGSPVWSPDGLSLAISEQVSVARGSAAYCPNEWWIDSCAAVMWLDIVDAQTGAPRRLDTTRVASSGTTSAQVSSWAWSPDGTSLLVTNNLSKKPWLVDVVTGVAAQLPWDVESVPNWHP